MGIRLTDTKNRLLRTRKLLRSREDVRGHYRSFRVFSSKTTNKKKIHDFRVTSETVDTMVRLLHKFAYILRQQVTGLRCVTILSSQNRDIACHRYRFDEW